MTKRKPLPMLTGVDGTLSPKRTWDRGKPRHQPTDVLRAEVSAYAIVGTPHHDISKLIGIDTKTLLKYYGEELRLGKIRANATVAQRLFAQTKHNVAAAIYWTKAQMGWREVQVIAHTTEPSAAPELADDCSAEEALAAYQVIIGGRKR